MKRKCRPSGRNCGQRCDPSLARSPVGSRAAASHPRPRRGSTAPYPVPNRIVSSGPHEAPRGSEMPLGDRLDGPARHGDLLQLALPVKEPDPAAVRRPERLLRILGSRQRSGLDIVQSTAATAWTRARAPRRQTPSSGHRATRQTAGWEPWRLCQRREYHPPRRVHGQANDDRSRARPAGATA